MIFELVFVNITFYFDSISEIAAGCSWSTPIKYDRLLFLIKISVEKVCSHKYVIEKGSKTAVALSKSWYSFLVYIQKSITDISLKLSFSVSSFLISINSSGVWRDRASAEFLVSARKGFFIQLYCSVLIVKK